jgi:FkbM family methyltransferase
LETLKEQELIELKFGKIRLLVKKEEAFIFYATFIANEYKNLKIKKNDVVIDFGANIGDFTVKAGKLLDNTGKIIAIEPNHENVEILRKNLYLNDVKNVEIFECAVTDKDGYSYLNGDDVAATVSDSGNGNRVKTISIETLLDRLNHPKNIVIKMDIEGGEKYIFKNEEFVHNIREIAIELHGRENIENIPVILKNNNFTIQKYKATDELKNTLKFVLLHPFNFMRIEKLSGYIAINGVISTFKNKENPIPSINNDDLQIIYAYRSYGLLP